MQNISYSLTGITAILLSGVIILLFIRLYAVKKNTKRRALLIKAEKDETGQKLKIMEEEACKMQLEKSEILSDYRSKEMELESKNKEIKQLINEKESLNKQIEEFMLKINECELIYEKQQEQKKEVQLLSLLFMDEIAKLIVKKLPKKEEYIEALKQIDRQYVYSLKKSFNGNLSIPYLKYCVCFAIGMEIGEVSECFSIEQSSVHVVRYRLKKKFGLNNNDDLDVFLKRQLIN